MATRAIGTLGTIDTLTVGGRVLTDLSSNLITLVAFCATGADYSTFRKPNGTSGYAVTAGKTLTIVALRMLSDGTDRVQLLYGNTDVGFTSGSAPTSPVYFGGSSSAYVAVISGAGVNENAPNFTVPQNLFPAILLNASQNTMVVAYGYEA